MKTFIVSCVLTLYLVATHAQSNPVQGKTYKGLISESCKSYHNKGCLESTYHILTFTMDSVWVGHQVESACDLNDTSTNNNQTKNIGKYSYQVQKKRNSANYLIRVNGYQIGSFEASPDKLIEFINDPSYPENLKKVFYLTN